MRIEQLYYFDTLVREGSFTKAAAQLHIAQPSLTSSIKSMEKELDVILVLRDAQGITLTDEGKKVLAFAQAVLKMQSNLLDTLKPSLQGTEKNITIFASNFFNRIVLENFLSERSITNVRYIESDPIQTLESFFINGCNFAILSRLTAEDESQCSLGMLTPKDKFFNSDFVYVPIFHDVFGVCMAQASPLAHAEILTPKVLEANNCPLTIFPHRGIKISDRIMFASNTIKHHVKAITENHAVCTIPYFAYKYHFANEADITFRAYDNQVNIAYYLIYPIEHLLTASEQLFIDELQHYLTEMKFK